MSEEPSKAIIFDTGSGYCKAGMAGDEAPACSILNIYSYNPSLAEPSHLIGEQALSHLPGLIHPISRGLVQDLSALERLWQHCYLREMKLDSTEHPVLASISPEEKKTDKEAMTLAFFETFGVPGYYCMSSALMALYGSGKASGLIVDSGEGLTSVVPVLEGYSLSHAQAVAEFGGKEITEYLASLLKPKAVLDLELVRAIKERRGAVATDFEQTLGLFRAGTIKTVKFDLPDGTFVELGDEIVKANEALFQPWLCGSQEAGVQDIITECLYKVDSDVRRELLANVVLAGGNTLHKNYAAR